MGLRVSKFTPPIEPRPGETTAREEIFFRVEEVVVSENYLNPRNSRSLPALSATIIANAGAVAGVGLPVLSLVVTGAAEASVGVSVPDNFAGVFADAVAVSNAGIELDLEVGVFGAASAIAGVDVAISGPVQVVAGAGAVSGTGVPLVELSITGDAVGVTDSGIVSVEAYVSSEAESIVSVGTPQNTVSVSADASSVVDTEFSIVTDDILVTGNVSAVPEVSAVVERSASISADLAAEADAGTNIENTVLVASNIGAETGVGTPGLTIEITNTVSAAANAGVDVERSVSVDGNAAGISDTLANIENNVIIVGEAIAASTAFAPVERTVQTSGNAIAIGISDADVNVVGGVSVDWTPDDLVSATIELWLDAQDAATITKDGGDLVSQWNDKSGNANNATQAQVDRKPIFTAANANFYGNPTVSNINSGDGMALGSASSVGQWLVDSVPAVGVGGLYANIGSYPQSALLASVYPAGFTIADNIHWRDGVQLTSSADDAGTDPAAAGAAFLMGRLVGSGLGTTFGRIIDGSGLFNRTSDWTRTANIEAGEIIILAGTLTTDDRQKMEGYLAWKWGHEASLPIGHPYELSAPTTAAVGASVEVSAPASAEAGVDSAAIDVTPLASGPTFEAGVISAWDPDAGADISGVIADAVGSSNMWARNGAAAAASWDGALNSDVVLVVDHADLAAFKAGQPRTLSFWLYEDPTNPSYGNLVNNTFSGFLPGGGGVNGEWRISRSGTADTQFTVQMGYAGGGTSATPRKMPTGSWRLWTIRLGAGAWSVKGNAAENLVDISWSSQTWPASNVAPLCFAGGAGAADHNETLGAGSVVGRFGDVRIWDKSLSDAEIIALNSAGRQSY